ncbi:DUF6090 family protein [Winogradskyella alexanderae]|uniref:Uncharacterized protein n=1 Tax=Winogradskyella alexanderae TaxID=2877123 RepID=A0ABS7XXD1_9FLAO|nr:DUF6090 family protein [Winogradskyella alexanderae]MCA0133552.1 hypothetical protein [Winogradskyella alexanderae]
MIKFFRHIRQRLLSEGKTGKYFKYAIGEIVLVVIGILIALQINTWNENRKANTLLNLYQENIIFELRDNLVHLKELDSINRTRKRSIETYIDYYNSENLNPIILKEKADSAQLQIALFNTNTYSLEDLMTTGNIKLFPLDKKNALLKYKKYEDQFVFLQSKTIDFLTTKFDDFERDIDIIFTNGYSNKEHMEVKNWAYDLNSSQFRKRNNYIISFLELYGYQINALTNLSKETVELKNTLENK